MVTSVTTLGRSGLSDWLIQRVTGVILAFYTLFMVVYLAVNPDMDYGQWLRLFQCLPVKLFTLAAVLSVAAHAWIGLWSVLTDYVTVRLLGAKATAIRVVLEVGMIIVILAFVIWAIDILWGI